MDPQLIDLVETILAQPDSGARSTHARDMVSTALTELVMHAGEPAMTPATPKQPQLSADLDRKDLKGWSSSDTPGKRRKREITAGSAGRSPGSRGGSPKRKGLSRTQSASGPSAGRTRSKKGSPSKPAAGRGGVGNKKELPGMRGRVGEGRLERTVAGAKVGAKVGGMATAKAGKKARLAGQVVGGAVGAAVGSLRKEKKPTKKG